MKRISLRKAREKKGWTQEQLERESGVAQAIISRLETAPDTRALFDTVIALADALEVDPRSLRFGPESQERVSA